jgi:hypothetical protein
MDIRNQLDEIIGKIEIHCGKGSKLHEVERDLFGQLLKLGLHILGYYVLLANELLKQKGTPMDSRSQKMENKGESARTYVSVFGRIKIKRSKYYSNWDKVYCPLDAYIGLPHNGYSYVLNDWLGYGSTELDFRQSVNQLERILGHQLFGMQSSRRTYALSEQVEDFYEQKEWSSVEDGTHLSVGYDGKGVPLIRSQIEESTPQSTSARLGRGQKKGVKKEATVSVSSSFRPKPRKVEEIICSLFTPAQAKQKKGLEEKHQWHEQKHIRAFLSDKPKAIEYGIDNLLKRDASGKKPIVVLIDGDRALENAVKKTVEEKGIADRIDAYVLDFIHLLEYIWKVANAHLGEKHPDREKWVQQQAILFLNSQHEKVLEQWRGIAKEKKIKPAHAYYLKRAITYVSNRPHMLDYKSYLEKGYPITTGAVESACGHFVKSRMERNAMHWGKQGAQRMLNIRAVKKNDEWDEFMEYYINKEQRKLYGAAA